MTDKELFEKLARDGECWGHNWEYTEDCRYTIYCPQCNQYRDWDLANAEPGCRVINFTTWEGFGWLWERTAEKEWWLHFEVSSLLLKGLSYYIHPIRFRDALKEYLKGRIA